MQTSNGNYWCLSENPPRRLSFGEVKGHTNAKHNVIKLQPWKPKRASAQALPKRPALHAKQTGVVDTRPLFAPYVPGVFGYGNNQGPVGDCTCASWAEDAWMMDVLAGVKAPQWYSMPFAYAVVRLYEGNTPPLTDTGAQPIDIGLCWQQ